MIPAAASPTQPREDQLGLFDDGAGPVPLLPDLTAYDSLLVNSSGGKDSHALLDCVHGRALAQGVTDRITSCTPTWVTSNGPAPASSPRRKPPATAFGLRWSPPARGRSNAPSDGACGPTRHVAGAHQISSAGRCARS